MSAYPSTPTTDDPPALAPDLSNFFSSTNTLTPDTASTSSTAFTFDDDNNLAGFVPAPAPSRQVHPFPSVQSFYAGPTSGAIARRRQSWSKARDGFANKNVKQRSIEKPGEGFVGVEITPGRREWKEVRIEELEGGIGPVSVMGRIVANSGIRSFQDKKNPTKHHTSQSIFVKDDTGIVECKIWYNTPEATNMFAKLELDILIHIRAPDTRILRPATTLTPSPIVATTPVLLTFSDRDIEHGAAGIDRLPPDPALFRRPVALGGIVKLAVLIAEADTGGVIGERRVMVCVKKIYPAQDIRIRRGWSRRRGVNVFDDSAGDIEITLWGGQVGVADSWSEFRTVLLITNPQVSVFRDKTQLGISFKSYVEIDPECNDAEFLRHFVRTVFPDSEPSSDDTLPSMLATGSNLIEVDISQITTLYTIAQLDTCANELSPLETAYGFLYVMIAELDVDSENPERSVVNLECPTCHKHYPPTTPPPATCPACTTPAHATYSLSSFLSFIDDTAELRHPRIEPGVAETLLCGPAERFWKLAEKERTEVKMAALFERWKVYFKMYWDDARHRPTITIVDASMASLREMAGVYEM